MLRNILFPFYKVGKNYFYLLLGKKCLSNQLQVSLQYTRRVVQGSQKNGVRRLINIITHVEIHSTKYILVSPYIEDIFQDLKNIIISTITIIILFLFGIIVIVTIIIIILSRIK